MNYYVLSLFPEMIETALKTSITGRAIEQGLLGLFPVNIRDFSENKHKKVDDYPYGGGAGMVMQPQPVYLAYESVVKQIAQRQGQKAGISQEKRTRCIYLTPQGKVFNQQTAVQMAQEENLIFLCGHYEGIDERVLEEIVTDSISIGDYVLTGGELPALVLMDSIARLLPGVLHNDASAQQESFAGNLLEHPQYTRPEIWKGKKVPEVLLSGHEKKVAAWRREESLKRTKLRRPDLYEKHLSMLETNPGRLSPPTILREEQIDGSSPETYFYQEMITEDLFQRINGRSYKGEESISISCLRYLRILHWGFDGCIHIGELIINKRIAKETLLVFRELFEKKYPIQKVLLVDYYNGVDEASMEDNNSSGFNDRLIQGTGRHSHHSLGYAIDINPLYNPYVKMLDGKLYCGPANGACYMDRQKEFPYKIHHKDLCYQIFKKYGFSWGGDWEHAKDYQHFEKVLAN